MLPRYDAAVLRRLSSKMQGDAQRFSARLHAKATPSTSTCPLSDDALVLQLPSPLTPELVAVGVNPSLAARISSAMTTALLRLKSNCEADFQRKLPLFREQLQRIPDPKFAAAITFTYVTIYNTAIRNHTSYLLREVAPRIVKAQALRQRIVRSPSSEDPFTPKRPFNPSAIPILEQYFEDNAFPTRLEKFELASKCDMAYKQIHVWFQNRRSRHRKEGKELKRRDGGNPVFDELETSVMDALLPVAQEDEQAESPSPHNIVTTTERSDFHLDRPAHAFPSPYPAICSYDPFPIEPGRRAFETKWPRSPSRQCCIIESPFGVSELVQAFRKMSLSGDSSSTTCASPLSVDSRPLHACLHPAVGFLTPCSRAPHPALIKRPGRIPRRAVANRSRSALHICQSSRPGNTKDCLAEPRNHSTDNLRLSIGSSPSSSPIPQRPRRTIPRRIPKNPPVNAAQIPPLDFPAPWTITKPCSTSSISSSDSSSGSDTESLIDTPPLPPVDLPHPSLFLVPEKVILGDHSYFQPSIIDLINPTLDSDQNGGSSTGLAASVLPSSTTNKFTSFSCPP